MNDLQSELAAFIAASRNPRPSEIRALVKAMRALEDLAKLGNGDIFGNSHGNTMAQHDLKEILADWRANQ